MGHSGVSSVVLSGMSLRQDSIRLVGLWSIWGFITGV